MPVFLLRDQLGGTVGSFVVAADRVSGLLQPGWTAEEVQATDTDAATALAALRRERDALLAASDWTESAAAAGALAGRDLIAWRIYRARLRDWPETEADPHAPTAPGWQDLTAIDPATLTAETRSRMVDLEQVRRTQLGFLYNGKLFGCDETATRNITAAGAQAGLAVRSVPPAVAGDYYWQDPSTPFQWITADNTLMPLDAYQTEEMSGVAATHVKRHIYAARTIKDLDPFPVDWWDDSYWPPSGGP